MRARIAVAIVLLVIGVVWIGQGIGLIGGSFMTGQAFWAVMGTIVVLIAVALLQGVRRERRQYRNDDH